MAEHHIYGTSRLGIQTYDTTYRNTFHVNTGIPLLTRLSANRSYYSGLYGEYVKYSYKEPWGGVDKDTQREQRTLGRRYYELTDHLGNVRTVVRSDYTPMSHLYLAGHEIASANFENSMFEHLDDVRDIKPEGVPGDEEGERLNGGNAERRIGAAIMLHVMSGDHISASVYGYHDTKGTENTYTDQEVMFNSLISTLAAGVGGYSGGAENNGTYIVHNTVTKDVFKAFNGERDGMRDWSRPQAFLNYLVFDEQYNFGQMASGAIQIGGTDNTWEQIATPSDLTIDQNGYILLYLSDEESKDVFFDNINVTHHNGRVMEEQRYYPHGLLINKSIASAPRPENRFQYQGNELQKELGMNLYDFNARQYDQQIGRFCSVDPMADQQLQESLSPYQFCNNDPANFVDPTGLYGAVSAWDGTFHMQEFIFVAQRNTSEGGDGGSEDQNE